MVDILRKQKAQVDLTSKSDINRAIGDIILSYLPAKKYPRAREAISSTIDKFLVDA
jgi:hypothetical protein